jgi:PAS domain S-box-containing protein
MELFASAMGLSLEEMQHHPSLIINAFDHQHAILFWNDAAARHFAIPTEQALGKKLEDVLPWTKKDERVHYIDRALMGKGMQVIRVPFRLKTGYYEQRVVPIRNSEGRVMAALSVVEEVAAPIPELRS